MAVAFPDQHRRPGSDGPSLGRSPGANAGLERLDDGTIVALRWLGPDDAERIRSGFEHLSPTSRYRRFFTPMPRLSEAMLQRLAATDGWDHVAIGAETVPGFGAHGDEAGVARFHRLRDRERAAEVAVTVVDAFQGLGLGRILLREVTRAARERGVDLFVANVLPENEPMLRLIHRLDPAAIPLLVDGVWTFEISIDPGIPRTPIPATPRRAA